MQPFVTRGVWPSWRNRRVWRLLRSLECLTTPVVQMPLHETPTTPPPPPPPPRPPPGVGCTPVGGVWGGPPPPPAKPLIPVFPAPCRDCCMDRFAYITE